MKNALFMLMVLFLTSCTTTTGGQNSVPADRAEQAAFINVQLGVDYMKKENYAMAEQKLLKALSYSPRSSLTHWTYGVLQEKLGYSQKAETYFKKAVRLNKKDAEAFNVYGAFLCRENRVEEALDAFDTAIANPLYNGTLEATLNAGDCLLQQQRYTDAKVYIKDALDINSESAKAKYLMAKLYYYEGRYAQSSILRRDISVAASDNPGVLWLCVMTERQTGDRNAEAICTKNLLRNYPTSSEAESI